MLLPADESELKDGLQELSLWWDALLKLDAESLTNPLAADFRQDLVWPGWDWPRGILLALEEFEFSEATKLSSNI